MQFDIFGSCISRDPFEFESSNHTVGKYVARSGLVSSAHHKKFDDSFQFDLGNSFRNRCLNEDLQKDFINYAKETSSKVLIVDLIQERYGLNHYEEGYYTFSQDHRLAKVPVGKIVRFDEHFKLFRKNINDIADMLSGYETIILHEANLCPIYHSKEGTIEKLAMNETDEYFIKNGSKYYNLFKEVVPNTYTLRINGLIGTEQHKWGPGKAHYEDKYHDIFNRGIDHILENKTDFYYLNRYGNI